MVTVKTPWTYCIKTRIIFISGCLCWQSFYLLFLQVNKKQEVASKKKKKGSSSLLWCLFCEIRLPLTELFHSLSVTPSPHSLSPSFFSRSLSTILPSCSLLYHSLCYPDSFCTFSSSFSSSRNSFSSSLSPTIPLELLLSPFQFHLLLLPPFPPSPFPPPFPHRCCQLCSVSCLSLSSFFLGIFSAFSHSFSSFS